MGFSLGYIPFSEISCFLNEQNISDFTERQEYIQWIQFIDREDVKLHHSKSESKKPSSQPKKFRR